MCGRFSQTCEREIVLDEFGLPDPPFDIRPRYNIAPTQDAAVVVLCEGEPRLYSFRWGLVPWWAKDPMVGGRMINARAESLEQRPAFQQAFERRRCLVLADGFYEWRKVGGTRIPMRVRLESGRPFAFAGLWERWRAPDGQPLRTFTIVTTDANDALRDIHDRMPVILSAAEREGWIDPTASPQQLRSLLRPYAAGDLEAYAVSRLVNSPQNDVPECILPVSEDLRLL